MEKRLDKKMEFYPHFCYNCLYNYFGTKKGKVIPCPRCGSTNVTDYRGGRIEKLKG